VAPNQIPETSSASPISNLSDQVPRILLAVRLKDPFRPRDLSFDFFKEWLRMIPTVAEDVKGEAGFGSFSSIVIVSVPITLSLYLPRDPAIIKIGPITSSNLVEDTPRPKMDLKEDRPSKSSRISVSAWREELSASSYSYADSAYSSLARSEARKPVLHSKYADSAYASSSAPTELGKLLNWRQSLYSKGLVFEELVYCTLLQTSSFTQLTYLCRVIDLTM
jgi:hypothetical protein